MRSILFIVTFAAWGFSFAAESSSSCAPAVGGVAGGVADALGTCSAVAKPLGPLEPTTSAQIRERAAAAGTQLTVVNVWATWCAPCRADLPDFAKFRQAYAKKGVRVELVSADSDEKTAQKFWRELKLDAPSYLVKEPLETFVKNMNSKWSAGLPATFLLDARGGMRAFWIGKTSYAKLVAEVEPALRALKSK